MLKNPPWQLTNLSSLNSSNKSQRTILKPNAFYLELDSLGAISYFGSKGIKKQEERGRRGIKRLEERGRMRLEERGKRGRMSQILFPWSGIVGLEGEQDKGDLYTSVNL